MILSLIRLHGLVCRVSHLDAVVVVVVLEELLGDGLALLLGGERARLVDVAVVEQPRLGLRVQLEGVQAQGIATERRRWGFQ